MKEKELIEVLKEFMEEHGIADMSIRMYPKGTEYGQSFSVTSWSIDINKIYER